jgi:hypothetical protein
VNLPHVRVARRTDPLPTSAFTRRSNRNALLQLFESAARDIVGESLYPRCLIDDPGAVVEDFRQTPGNEPPEY